jgi:serine/threonine-protein kinase
MAHNGLAWIKATCPVDELRDGKAAIEHATRACELTDWNDPDLIDTLACAYAEAGQFDQAIHWQTKICQEAPDNKDFAARLRLYQEGKPYRNDPAGR